MDFETPFIRTVATFQSTHYLSSCHSCLFFAMRPFILSLCVNTEKKRKFIKIMRSNEEMQAYYQLIFASVAYKLQFDIDCASIKSNIFCA